MEHSYDHYLRSLWKRAPLRIAVGVSVAAHAAAFGALLFRQQEEKLPPIPVTYSVQYAALPEPEAKAPKIPDPPKPEPEPPKKEAVKPKVEKKPDPPKKEEPKSSSKPKPKPPKPKPEPKKEPPPPPKKPEPKPKPPEKKPPPQKTGIQTEELPSVLNTWGRLVQKKVAKFWAVPGGVRLEESHTRAVISFWVDRDGRIIAGPEITEAAPDPTLGKSGRRAVLAAAPFPPLPKNFKGERQEVLYVFNLER